MSKLHLPLFSRTIVIVLLTMTQDIHAQYIKLDNKLVFSSFYNNKKLPLLSSEKVNSYSFLLGVDYLQKDWFYLSSQIGYMKIGGKETNLLLQGNDVNILESSNYIHLNTTFRAYVKSAGSKIFLGIGPYINILAGSKEFDSSLYRSDYNFKSLYAGGKAEIGFTQDINRFRIGLVGDYLYNMSASAASPYLILNNNTFSGAVSVGYRVR